MTLNGIMALSLFCYSTKYGSYGQLRRSMVKDRPILLMTKMMPKESILKQYMTYSDIHISQSSPRTSARKTTLAKGNNLNNTAQ